MSAESPHIISDPSQNAGPTILAVTLSMTFVAFAVLCLRLYVRRVMIRNLGIDVSPSDDRICRSGRSNVSRIYL